MPTVASVVPRNRCVAVALGAALLALGCASGSRDGAGAPLVSSAGTSLASATVSTSVRRVADRSPSRSIASTSARSRSTSTYRHYGTGRGVTVYVFDGGVARHRIPSSPVACGAATTPFPTRPAHLQRARHRRRRRGGRHHARRRTRSRDRRREDGGVPPHARHDRRHRARHAMDDRRSSRGIPAGAPIANWSFIADTAGTHPGARQRGARAPRRRASPSSSRRATST